MNRLDGGLGRSTALLSLMLIIVLSAQAQTINVMTFNIRYNNPADSLNAWPYRKDKVSSQIYFTRQI